MGENKRLLNIHEQKFVELAAFQANTTVFQANTNASLKNMETQVGQLALSIQNQSKDVFRSDTKKNAKDYMAVTLRSGRELENRKEDEKRKTGKEEAEEEIKLASSEKNEEIRKKKVQQEQPVEERNLKKKEEVQAYMPFVPFPQRL